MERAPGECILCGGTDRIPLVSDGKWTVHKCAGCGLGVLDPRPDPTELGQLYRESYFVSHYENVLPPGSDGMRRRLSQERHRVEFFRKHKSAGKVLDVGSGRGYFLEACRRRGYDVVGFDVSDDAAASVREAFGIEVKTGEMREDLFEPESLDVVTMWHALEHTTDPRVPLRLAWKWLSPDGILVVDVPNHESTDARRIGDAWDDWSLPYHFFHFTPSSLGDLLARNGFRSLDSKTYHSETVKRSLKKIPLVSLLARPIAKLYSGTSVAVVAKKTVWTSPGGDRVPGD
jgi:2-polyprenyl-3-methyl-5-hydroxy-6-metoxy-1,4-benzoquinol methylase